MKKLFYLSSLFIFLNIIIFVIISFFVEKKTNTHAKYYVIKELCDMSKFIEKEIGKKREFIREHWRRWEGNCDDLFRNSNWDIIFNNKESIKNFEKFLGSQKFKSLIYKKIKYNYEFANDRKNLFKRLYYKPTSTYNNDEINKSLKFFHDETERLLKILNLIEKESLDILIEIKEKRKIKQIDNFNFKLSLFISINAYCVILVFIFVFRRNQLGFYR